MTDFDFATFEKAFGRLTVAFRLKLKAPERDDLARTYFKSLDAHPIDAVIAAGKRCVEQCRVFPKVADWLHELGTADLPACPPDQRYMAVDEADALEYAAAVRYEADPCGCEACVAAGVDHRPLRFVPSTIENLGFERAFNPRRNKVEVVGHWAHGAELARWYAARAVFMTRTGKAPRALAQAVAAIIGREPGMEG